MALALSFGVSACSAGSNGSNTEVGTYDTGGAPGAGAAGGASGTGSGGTPSLLGDAGFSNALTAHIEQDHVKVEFVTVACGGGCADVVAVASGGYPPYSFTWEDGTTSAERRVCPTASTSYEVLVKDKGFSSPEFSQDPQTVKRPLRASVLACPPRPTPNDAGVLPDGGPFTTGTFCVANPGLEGTTTGRTETIGWTMTDWTICELSPDVGPVPDESPSLAATEGKTYFAAWGSASVSVPLPPYSAGTSESAAAAFCAPLSPRVPVPFQVDVSTIGALAGLVTPTSVSGNLVLELWGGLASCGRDELLWVSPPITSVGSFQTFCGTLLPAQADAFLRLVPRPAPGAPAGFTGGFVMVDNFRPATSCP